MSMRVLRLCLKGMPYSTAKRTIPRSKQVFCLAQKCLQLTAIDQEKSGIL